MPRPGWALVLLITALGTWAPTPIRAQGWTETRPIDLSDYKLVALELQGNQAISKDQIAGVLEEPLQRGKKRDFDLEKLDADVQRVRAKYLQEGFWDVQVDRRVIYNESLRQARVVIVIEEGAQHRVGVVSVDGNRSFKTDEVLGWVKIKKDDPFDLDRASEGRTEIETEYANAGFYLVEVIADIQRPSAETIPIVNDLVFRITEGPRFTMEKILIEGNAITEEHVIRRELRIREGEILSRERLEESRANLYATGYFARVDLLPQNPEASQGSVAVLVRVIERKMRFFGFGVGYGTQDQFRLSGEWGHRNFLGRGKRMTLRALLAAELFPYDLVRRRFEARYVEPWLFGTRTTGSVDVFFERRREFFRDLVTQERRDYDLRLVGLILNANRRITRFTRIWVSLENEWADLDAEPDVDPPDDLRPDVTRSFTLTGERDRRDDYFEPDRGFVNRAIGSVSGGILGGDNDFWKTSVESSWYQPIKNVVLAGRVRVGYERPYGQSKRVPDRDRFKIGGATTVRGYREQDIGPGDFLLLGNLEVRFPIVWIVHGGVFLDAGNAWQDADQVGWSDFSILDTKDDPQRAAERDVRYSTGVGVRVETPVGPVRVDYGYKLKILPVPPGVDREDRWRIHLSLGHVF
jgi:outer membrane protein insertion porin family